METVAVLIGESAAIHTLSEDADLAARSSATVLITGESGTRKEGLARLIHARSNRSRGAFKSIDCGSAAMDAFLTPASFRDQGIDAGASGGTIFLDEIGMMSPAAQTRLLQYLEIGCGCAERDRKSFSNDARIITATRERLLSRVQDGTFGLDLYYRVNVLHLRVPPLRERREDIPLLLTHFFKLLSVRYLRPVPLLEPETATALVEYNWPGNIRELRDVATGLVLAPRAGGIRVDDLPPHMIGPSPIEVAHKFEVRTPVTEPISKASHA